MSDTYIQSVGNTILDALQEWGCTERTSAFGDVYERSWSEELTNLLVDEGVNARQPQHYPRSRWTCDLVANLPNNTALWIEIKGAWSIIAKSVASNTPSYKANTNFRKHLFNSN
jgi:hypothetical protein